MPKTTEDYSKRVWLLDEVKCKQCGEKFCLSFDAIESYVSSEQKENPGRRYHLKDFIDCVDICLGCLFGDEVPEEKPQNLWQYLLSVSHPVNQ